MKRIVVLLAVVALMVVMLAMSVAPAFAQGSSAFGIVRSLSTNIAAFRGLVRAFRLVAYSVKEEFGASGPWNVGDRPFSLPYSPKRLERGSSEGWINTLNNSPDPLPHSHRGLCSGYIPKTL